MSDKEALEKSMAELKKAQDVKTERLNNGVKKAQQIRQAQMEQQSQSR